MSGLSVGRWSTIVGYNLIDDRANLAALVPLAEKFTALETEVTSSPNYVAHGPLYVFWLTVGAPLIAEWRRFYDTQSTSYAERRFLTPEILASWQRRLDEVRGAADRVKAMVATHPIPTPVTRPPAPAPVILPAPSSPPTPPVQVTKPAESAIPRGLVYGGVAVGALLLIALAVSK